VISIISGVRTRVQQLKSKMELYWTSVSVPFLLSLSARSVKYDAEISYFDFDSKKDTMVL
jgi:hypothetical protein